MSDMASVSRRDFFRVGAAAAAATVVPATAYGQETTGKPQEPETPIVLPRRKLGRSGVEVTILSQGAGFKTDLRHLNVTHSMGVRYLDTAKAYLKGANERAIGEWFEKEGHRKEYFLVTKDQPRSPEEISKMVDERLESLKTDYIDLFFVHALGDSDDYHGLEDTKWFTDPEWTKAVDAVRKSGKARLVGFSIHTDPLDVRTGMLSAAAKGGWVDAVMVAADPVLIRENAEFNKALDACHKAGTGLISMKQGRGVEKIKDIFPTFEKRGLSTHTAVLTAMWTDERFTAVCSHMKTLEELRENATAARNFKPLSKEELGALNTMLKEGERTFCVACDGSCRRAAGTQARLNRIARYVSYAEQDGRVYEASALLSAMPPEDREWSGADLAAASHACKCRLDYARIVARAEELLA
jgi:aryl-alcohol dehydrogenase-like predicted oxidoreductase